MIDTPCKNALSGEMAEVLQFGRTHRLAAFRRSSGRIPEGAISSISRAIIEHKTAAFRHAAAGSNGPRTWISRQLDERAPAGMKHAFGNIKAIGINREPHS